MKPTASHFKSQPKGLFLLATFATVLAFLLLFQPSSVEAEDPIWSASGNNIYNANAGNVGIGTTSPLNKLSVTGSGTIANFWAASTPYVSIGDNVDHTASGTKRIQLGFDTTNNIGAIDAVHQGFSLYPLVLNGSGGNVGIGTTTPLNRLSVTGSGIIANFWTASTPYVSIGDNVDHTASGTKRIQVGFDTANNIGTIDAVHQGFSLYPIVLNGSGGNVGIGTTNPTSGTLQVTGNPGTVAIQTSNNSNSPSLTFNGSGSGVESRIVSDTNNNLYLQTNNGSGTFAGIYVSGTTNHGYVGIGTTNPSSKFHVEGNVTVSGNIAAKYQDIAEWVPSAAPIPPGTVVVLERNVTNAVTASSKSYDTRLAGVISASPGIVLGDAGENKVKVATTGRVRVRVNARQAAIEVGDLLVTSDQPGTAMKSEPVIFGGIEMHRPGTLLGKALEPLAHGEGEILVLLSLQ